MALIKCGECGNEVSDKAGSCPGCGAPIASVATQEPIKVRTFDDEVQEGTIAYIFGGAAALIYIGLVGGIGWKFFGEMGFYIGAGLAFISCLFIEMFRLVVLAIIMTIAGFGAVGYLIYWLTS